MLGLGPLQVYGLVWDPWDEEGNRFCTFGVKQLKLWDRTGAGGSWASAGGTFGTRCALQTLVAACYLPRGVDRASLLATGTTSGEVTPRPALPPCLPARCSRAGPPTRCSALPAALVAPSRARCHGCCRRHCAGASLSALLRRRAVTSRAGGAPCAADLPVA